MNRIHKPCTHEECGECRIWKDKKCTDSETCEFYLSYRGVFVLVLFLILFSLLTTAALIFTVTVQTEAETPPPDIWEVTEIAETPVETSPSLPVVEAEITYAEATAETPPEPERMPVPLLSNSACKPYMDYRTITDETSEQWEYIHNSGNIEVSQDGYLTTPDGYIGVALGSYFDEIGEKYVFVLENDKTLNAVKVDEKADCDMNPGSFSHPIDDHVIEFIVDVDKMREHIMENGYVYWGNFNNCDRWRGEIIEIWKITDRKESL